jgi:hypothetical protein
MQRIGTKKGKGDRIFGAEKKSLKIRNFLPSSGV